MLSNIRNLLIIGLDTAALACSAKNTGHEVYCVDYFGDSDLKKTCAFSLSVIDKRNSECSGKIHRDFNPKGILVLVKRLIEKHKVDGILLASGLEDHPQVLSALSEWVPIIGNDYKTIEKVRNKENFFNELKRIRVRCPETRVVTNLEEAQRNSRDIGYPVVIKPFKGFGGFGIQKITNPKKLEASFRHISPEKKFLIQKYIKGIAASASVISTKERARTLTVNEQLLGDHSLGQVEPFGYCGNIVPLSSSRSVMDGCVEVSEKVVTNFNLVGSNGVDLVITEEGKPYVIEVNPRFQGTLECVERVLHINVVQAHIDACVSGVLIEAGKTDHFCVRLIVYALKRSRIPVLDGVEGIRNIPFKDLIVEKGEPICSIIIEDSSRSAALRKARNSAKRIYLSIV